MSELDTEAKELCYFMTVQIYQKECYFSGMTKLKTLQQLILDKLYYTTTYSRNEERLIRQFSG